MVDGVLWLNHASKNKIRVKNDFISLTNFCRILHLKIIICSSMVFEEEIKSSNSSLERSHPTLRVIWHKCREYLLNNLIYKNLMHKTGKSSTMHQCNRLVQRKENLIMPSSFVSETGLKREEIISTFGDWARTEAR